MCLCWWTRGHLLPRIIDVYLGWYEILRLDSVNSHFKEHIQNLLIVGSTAPLRLVFGILRFRIYIKMVLTNLESRSNLLNQLKTYRVPRRFVDHCGVLLSVKVTFYPKWKMNHRFTPTAYSSLCSWCVVLLMKKVLPFCSDWKANVISDMLLNKLKIRKEHSTICYTLNLQYACMSSENIRS